MGRTVLTLILALWAVVATLFAVVHIVPEDAGMSPILRDAASAASDLEETRRLRRRVAELQTALQETLRGADPAPDGETVGEKRTIAQRLDDVLTAEREHQDSDGWNVKRAHELRRAMYRLLAESPETQALLAERLRHAETDEDVRRILSYLVWSQGAQFTTRKDVVDRVREIARGLLADENPHRREGAAYALLRYRGAERSDWLLALGRLDEETVPDVRDALVDGLTVTARDLALTRDEVRPFLAHIRRGLEAGDPGWAGVLAEWSDSPEDFDWVRRRFEAETSPGGRQSYLNAFARGGRLVRGRETEARNLLLRVMANPDEDANLRGLAVHILRSHTPWDEATAEAVRRYREETGKR